MQDVSTHTMTTVTVFPKSEPIIPSTFSITSTEITTTPSTEHEPLTPSSSEPLENTPPKGSLSIPSVNHLQPSDVRHSNAVSTFPPSNLELPTEYIPLNDSKHSAPYANPSTPTGESPTESSLTLYSSNISVQIPALERDSSSGYYNPNGKQAFARTTSPIFASLSQTSAGTSISISAPSTGVLFPSKHRKNKSDDSRLPQCTSIEEQSTLTSADQNLTRPTSANSIVTNSALGHPSTSFTTPYAEIPLVVPQIQSAHFSMQGVRAEMEDKVVLLPHPQFNTQAGIRDSVPRHYFAVFDGHGGDVSAEYCRQHVHLNFLSDANFESNPTLAIRSALLRTDHDFCNACRRINLVSSSGTTALCAYLLNCQLFVANVGDSRGVLSRNGRAVAVSNDHKPGRRDEKERIENLGGRVCCSEDIDYANANSMQTGGKSHSSSFCSSTSCLPIRSLFSPCFTPLRPLRVFPGGLSVSRTIGDLSMKSTALVIAEPEIFSCRLTPSDKFLIMACDGVWDVISNQQAVNTVVKYLPNVDDAAKQLAKEAFRRGSTDNISVVIIRFIWPAETKDKKNRKEKARLKYTKSSSTDSCLEEENKDIFIDNAQTNPKRVMSSSRSISGQWFR